jgi:two-component system chemotaxis response regulator CheY
MGVRPQAGPCARQTFWLMSEKQKTTINIRGLAFLIADANAYFSSICHSILRGFGATRVLEARDADDARKMLAQHKVDLLLCDHKLPPGGGLEFTRWIRIDPANEFRTIPILIMTTDTRSTIVANARDCGANMVLVKPVSPSSLYDRLVWIAFNARKFVDSKDYFGPDRRFKIEGYPNGVGRRASDKAVDLGTPTGPALSQSDIDALLKASRNG